MATGGLSDRASKKRVVVKVGTKVITDDGGVLDEAALARIAAQLAQLRVDGHEVVLVSSGAMGAGKSLLKTRRVLTAVSEKQLFAAVGQAHLMGVYSRLFAPHGLLCAQVLATKEDFRDRLHHFNMRGCFEALLHDGVLPVVNENDVVALDELTFTDNDELAELVASMLGADLLLILSSVPGVLDADGRVIAEVNDANRSECRLAVSADRSEAGRGGMVTKFEAARRAAAQGIEAVIADGGRDGVILDVVAGLGAGSVNCAPVGTRFTPGRRLDRARRRLAHAPADGLVRGAAHINECAAAALLAPDTAASLLPVGVMAIEGEFERGDIISIAGPDGARLGYGVAAYSSTAATAKIGQKGQRPLIHYDYMFIW